MKMTDNPEQMDEEVAEEPRSPFEAFVYHQRRALEETGKALEALLPEGFRTHGGNASKEFADSFRVLVDAAVNELKKAKSGEESDDEDDGREPSTGKSKVKIPVE
jgi:hypothetical protein